MHPGVLLRLLQDSHASGRDRIGFELQGLREQSQWALDVTSFRITDADMQSMQPRHSYQRKKEVKEWEVKKVMNSKDGLPYLAALASSKASQRSVVW